MTTKWQQPWEKRHKTVRAVCVSCIKISYVTLYGLLNEYRDMINIQQCKHCGKTGTLSTSDLAKSRIKHDTTRQLNFGWANKKITKDVYD